MRIWPWSTIARLKQENREQGRTIVSLRAALADYRAKEVVPEHAMSAEKRMYEQWLKNAGHKLTKSADFDVRKV